MIKTISRIYNISSSNADDNGFKSNVRIQIPDLNFSNQSIKNVSISVLHAEVPNSFYVINYTNNTIVINNITYTLIRGNYNVNTFITALLTLLPVGFNITYSSITNKFTMTNTTNFTINCSNPNCKINKVIGLPTTDLTSTSLTLSFPYNVNFLPIARINFKSDFIKFNNYNQNDNSSNIFLSLQNNAPQQGMINYNNTNNVKFLVEEKYITSFLISVVDDFGNLINFNNVDWYICFLIEIDYLQELSNLGFNQLIKSF